MSFVGCRIEVSGMDPAFEATVKDLALKSCNADSTFDQKAKQLIEGMEKEHGFYWACAVEPHKTFVQTFAVSKRPDQYIRMICNSDRIRLWRLNDPTVEVKVEQIDSELIADRNNLQQQLNEC